MKYLSKSVSTALGSVFLAASLPASADLAILQYHHISNETPASTSTTPSLFRGQLDMIKQLDLSVKPLESATRSALAGEMSGESAVAITFDDAYSSVYETAAPLLLERGYPFTVFVNSQAIDDHRHGYMTWEQLEELASHPEVTIGNHSADHGHMARKPGEAESDWQARVTASMDGAQDELAKKLETSAPLFAYPYGEFDSGLMALVADRDWYGYGQHSGPVGATSDATRLPRFPMATAYGQLSSLEDKLLSQALPVDATALPDGIVSDNPPKLTLALPADLSPNPLTCYGSRVGRLKVTSTGTDNAVEITADQAFSSRRFRYNCTYPTGNGRYYWQSVQWLDLAQPED